MSEFVERPVSVHRPPRRAARAPQRWPVEQVQALFELPFAEFIGPRMCVLSILGLLRR